MDELMKNKIWIDIKKKDELMKNKIWIDIKKKKNGWINEK